MELQEITKRYGELAENQCCLSCGGALTLSKPSQGEVCIDLGSGRGTDAIRLAEVVGKNGFVYGVDATEEMIKKSNSMAEKLVVENIKFIQSDLENIPLDNDISDLIISNCTINHVANKENVWNEIFRLLKTGGRFVISDIYSIGNVPDEYKNDPAAVAECWAGAIPKNEYLKIIISAGFKNISILEESKPYDKGKIQVCSFTIYGEKQKTCCCCKS